MTKNRSTFHIYMGWYTIDLTDGEPALRRLDEAAKRRAIKAIMALGDRTMPTLIYSAPGVSFLNLGQEDGFEILFEVSPNMFRVLSIQMAYADPPRLPGAFAISRNGVKRHLRIRGGSGPWLSCLPSGTGDFAPLAPACGNPLGQDRAGGIAFTGPLKPKATGAEPLRRGRSPRS